MPSHAQTSTVQLTPSQSYTTEQVGELLGISRWNVNKLISSGALPAFNVGSAARPRLRVTATALHAFQADRQIGT